MFPSDRFDLLRVVLVATRNPLNLGAAARAVSNFGFSGLRVVNPFQAAFREARSAVGASTVLLRAQEYNSVAEAVADCTLVVGTTAVRHRRLQHPLRRLETEKQMFATAGEYERITNLLLDAMYASGYLKQPPTRGAEERLRPLIRRLNLPMEKVAKPLFLFALQYLSYFRCELAYDIRKRAEYSLCHHRLVATSPGVVASWLPS
jgi:hypothetical protein